MKKIAENKTESKCISAMFGYWMNTLYNSERYTTVQVNKENSAEIITNNWDQEKLENRSCIASSFEIF